MSVASASKARRHGGRQQTRPSWSLEILSFRLLLDLSQAKFAEKLGTSAMAVSRWERGEQEPTERSYIRLGNLATDPLCWFFWGRAGLSTADIMRVLPAAQQRLSQDRIAAFQIVNAGGGKTIPIKLTDFVAIPVLPVNAATPGEQVEEVHDLDQLKPQAVWAAPAAWCPNPARTISLRVRGNSMSPLILDGYLIAVDTSEVPRGKLLGQIVVAWSKKTKQLIVSRLLRFDRLDALVSDQRGNRSILLAAEAEWRIVGRVIWWAGKAPAL